MQREPAPSEVAQGPAGRGGRVDDLARPPGSAGAHALAGGLGPHRGADRFGGGEDQIFDLIAGRGRRDLDRGQDLPEAVDRGCGVLLGVGVDPDDHLAHEVVICCHGARLRIVAVREHLRPGRRTGHLGCRPMLLSGHVRPTGRGASRPQQPVD